MGNYIINLMIIIKIIKLLLNIKYILMLCNKKLIVKYIYIKRYGLKI